ncbi:MAG: hypothetical protein JW915_19370 [Chitinispirillaceae bacterium]|nr:hypothetical protein [Chitinispirillaceae bacterium]
MEKEIMKRTQDFRWNSKVELYTYFDEKYGMNKDVIDGAIASTVTKFRLRKHQAIKTQELWQKVGNLLECEYHPTAANNN